MRNKFNTFIVVMMSSIILLSTTSCTLFSSGTASSKEEKGRTKIELVDTKIAGNTADKLNIIGELAYGTDYALGKLTNPPIEVSVAKDMNQRVESIAGSPAVDKMKEMQDTINKLTSALATEQREGRVLLSIEDQKLTDLQTESKQLISEKDDQIHNYMNIAQAAAAKSDSLATQLESYTGWFGLKAVAKGLLQFAKSAMWILGIGGVIFVVLRIASMFNPIAASIFSIFDTIGSWLINSIAMIFPKALSIAGNVTTTLFNSYKGVMTKFVDAVQMAKTRASAAGKQPTLEDVLNELEKSMDTNEKAIVDDIKKQLGWK